MTDIAEKLKGAGADTDSAQLRGLAENCLKRANQNYPLAFRRFVESLSGPVMALMGREKVHSAADGYLKSVQDDMKGSRIGASHKAGGSLNPTDRPDSSSSNSSRLSLLSRESQSDTDRPAAPLTRDDAASQITPESHKTDDHRVAPATRIGSRAAASVAMSSVYDMTLGSSLTFRNAYLADIINGERAGSKFTRVMTLLRTRKAWPEGATVPQVYSERELKQILDEAQNAIPPLPLEAQHG